MKKNILTIIILAMTCINVVLTAVIIFVVVPTSNRTINLVGKIASIIDLEMESPDAANKDITVADIATVSLSDKLTVNLKKNGDDSVHYAQFPVTLSVNTKNEDTVKLQPKITESQEIINEFISDEFGKYTVDDVQANKEKIKLAVLDKIKDYFNSDFIIRVSFGNIILT